MRLADTRQVKPGPILLKAQNGRKGDYDWEGDGASGLVGGLPELGEVEAEDAAHAARSVRLTITMTMTPLQCPQRPRGQDKGQCMSKWDRISLPYLVPSLHLLDSTDIPPWREWAGEEWRRVVNLGVDADEGLGFVVELLLEGDHDHLHVRLRLLPDERRHLHPLTIR